jgi:hypothetical protein
MLPSTPSFLYPMRATCLASLILLVLITALILGKKVKGKVKLSLEQAVNAYRVVRRRSSHIFSRKWAHRWRWGCQPYAPATLYPPGRFRVLISVSGWVQPRATVQLEGLSKLKKKIHLIGTRTRDLPDCSIVPQPTTLPRAPIILGKGNKLWSSSLCTFLQYVSLDPYIFLHILFWNTINQYSFIRMTAQVSRSNLPRGWGG